MVQEVGPNQENEAQVHNHFPMMECDLLSMSGDSSSGMTDVGIKTDSKMLLKLGNITGVNNDSGI